MQLQQYRTPSQRTQQDEDTGEQSDEDEEQWNQFFQKQGEPRFEQQNIRSENQSVGEQDQEDQNLQDHQENQLDQEAVIESQQDMEAPDEQKDQQKDQVQLEQQNILPNQDEESDFMQDLNLKQFEERISTFKAKKQEEKQKQIELELNPIIIPPPTIEEILIERKIITPEEYFLFKNSWKFYLLICIITPLVVLLMFNIYFPIYMIPLAIFSLFIYIWLIQLHLQFYITDYRCYVIQAEIPNIYYLSLTYMEADFLFPWLFFVENSKINQIKAK